MNNLILPDSRAKQLKGAIQTRSGWKIPIHCPSCHTFGGYVPEESTFVFWLCNPCFATYGDLTHMYVMPDEVYWATVKEAQQEYHGRELTPEETILALSDPDSLESRLAKDRALLTPKSGV